MSGRPRRACQRCSIQKIRCIGDKPTCERCKRLGRVCLWVEGNSTTPRPTDSTRWINHSTGPNGSLVSPRVDVRPVPISIPRGVPQDYSNIGIPSDLVFKLVDTYYACVYSSSLLFHKRSLLRDLEAKSVKPHIVLSICALAASFYQRADDANPFGENGFNRLWAEQASRLLFEEVERPDEDKLVSFTILCLFWYSQGDWERAVVHESLALVNLRLTGLSKAFDGAKDSLLTELKCRRFWGAYLVNQFVSEPAPSFTWGTISRLRLPCQEEHYENWTGSHPQVMIQDEARTPSIYAELIRITALWSSVYDLIRDATKDPASILSTLNVLDAKLRQWKTDLPSVFSHTPENLAGFDPDTRSKVSILHIIYLQCMCALHASIVPVFSLGPAQPFRPYVHTQRVSSQIAYEHACEISDMIQKTLEQYPDDVFRWPGFVGYALYCSCAIQLPFLWCIQPAICESTKSNIKANLETMAKIGRNWRYVLNLGIHVRRLYQHHSTDPIPLPAEMYHASASDLSGNWQAERNSSSVLGQNEIVWDYGRTLARGERMNLDQGQSGDSIEGCKDLIEQGSPGTVYTINARPQEAESSAQSLDQTNSDIIGKSNVSASRMTVPTQETMGARPLQSSSLPSSGLNLMTTPAPLFNDMNISGISEDEQSLFLRAMSNIQAADLDGTNGYNDAFEDWLKG